MRNPEKENFLLGISNKERKGSEKPENDKLSRFKSQIILPPEQWSKEFKDYIKEKWEEKEIKESQYGYSLQETEFKRRHLERYLKLLNIPLNYLKDKTVLDIGCGRNGEFVKEAREKEIKAFGLDLKIDLDNISLEERKYFVKADFEKSIPFKNIDLILSIGAANFCIQFSKERLKKVLLSWLKSVKPDGEMRIYPVMLHPISDNKIQNEEEKWEEVLKELSLKKNLDFSFQPINFAFGQNEEDVYLNETLIIKTHN